MHSNWGEAISYSMYVFRGGRHFINSGCHKTVDKRSPTFIVSSEAGSRVVNQFNSFHILISYHHSIIIADL